MAAVTEAQVRAVFEAARATIDPDGAVDVLCDPATGLTPLFNQNGSGGTSSSSWDDITDIPPRISTFLSLGEGTVYVGPDGSLTTYPISDFGKDFVAKSTASLARTALGAEASLGNPASDGRVLSSTMAGARSWVLPNAHAHSIADVTNLQASLDAKLATVTGDATSRAANTFYAAPSASAGVATFRTIVVADLPSSGVTAGSYGSASMSVSATVDAKGRVTAMSATSIAIDASQVTTGTLGYARGGTGLSAPGATAGNLRWSGSAYTIDTASYALSSAIPVASSTTPAALGTAAVGTGTTWARADHVHAMPTAVQVGAEPALGNPGTSGYVLSSTTAGVRSWVALPTVPVNLVTGLAATGQVSFWSSSSTLSGSPKVTTDGSSLTLYDGSDSGDYAMLTFNTARPWAFRNSGVGGLATLRLASTVSSKWFQVGHWDGSTFFVNAGFYASSTGAYNSIPVVTVFDYSTASTVPYFNASKQLVSSSVTATELGYLSGVTSAIQPQLASRPTGSATANQVPYWSSSSSLAGSVNFVFDGTKTLNVGVASSSTSQNPSINLVQYTGAAGGGQITLTAAGNAGDENSGKLILPGTRLIGMTTSEFKMQRWNSTTSAYVTVMGSTSANNASLDVTFYGAITASSTSPRIDLRESNTDTQWSIESYFGKFRFVVGYNSTPVSVATLDSSANFILGESGDKSPSLLLHSASGGNANIMFRTGSSNRALLRWDPTVDAFTLETRNDDGSGRNESLRIPRSSSSPVVAGGADVQSWNFTGNVSVFGSTNPRSKVDFSSNWTNASYRNYMEFRVGAFQWCNDGSGNIVATAWRGGPSYTTASPIIQLAASVGYLGFSTTSSGTGTVTYPYLTWDSSGLYGVFASGIDVPGITFGVSSIKLKPNGATVIGAIGSFTLPMPVVGAVVIAYVSSQPASNISVYTTSGYFIEYISSGTTTVAVDGATGVAFTRSAAIFIGVSTYGGNPRWRMIW